MVRTVVALLLLAAISPALPQSLFDSVRQQQQQQRQQRAPGRPWSSRRRPGPGTDWTLLAEDWEDRQEEEEQEEQEERAGRPARSTSWLTSNTTARSVLPPDYDMLEKPRSPVPGQPLKVSLSLKVRDIQDINEEHMELATEMFLRFYWTDSRLIPPETLKPGQWFNLHPAIFDQMWKPITFVDHMKGLRIYKLISPASSLRMQSDGFIRYSVLLTVTIVCKMSFRDYPFDSQHCVFHLEDYSYRTEEVVYEWEPPGIEVSPDLTHDHYDIRVEVLATQNYSHHTMSFPALEFHVNLQRRLSFHLLQTFIPSALFVWVGWLSFLVPPEVVPGRMVLTITTLLTLTAMFNAVRAESPKASYAKAVDIWMAGCVLFVFFALSEYVIVIRMMAVAEKKKKKRERELRERELSASNAARPIRVNGGKVAPNDSTESETRSNGTSTPQCSHEVAWDVMASRLERFVLYAYPITFLAFNVAYWCYYLFKHSYFSDS
ncbi:glycine receptor subunit alphaZ1-like [Amphibalanus amphitrite]|uniref:glycine receptor subunit alphaZ1-like n=1 Tax=Amphibalanus amphitrite TaxID=1232801 RepID=UPI001C927D29|nr:glycine receptor subunit alphaZ1-like [Amphibalanus amphitrite]